MKKRIIQRTLAEAKYMLNNGGTIRDIANKFKVCKSTVHLDLNGRLPLLDYELWASIRNMLDINLEERHIRGGIATKKRWEKQ